MSKGVPNVSSSKSSTKTTQSLFSVLNFNQKKLLIILTTFLNLILLIILYYTFWNQNEYNDNDVNKKNLSLKNSDENSSSTDLKIFDVSNFYI